MSVEFQQHTDLSSVKMTEALTIFEVGDIARKLAENLAPANQYELDLAGIEEIDASGIQLLLSLQKTLRDNQAELLIASVSDEVLDTMKMFGLSTHFSFRQHGEENA